MFRSLKTERLILKNIGIEDRNFVFQQFSDPKICRYLFDAEPLISIEGADEIIGYYLQPEPRLQHRWILVRNSDNQKIGTCGVHCYNTETRTIDVGYDLQTAFHGQGYMHEAMSCILQFIISEMHVNTIRACIYPENGASINLVKKFGFTPTGSYYETFRGKKYLHAIYTLKVEERKAQLYY